MEADSNGIFYGTSATGQASLAVGAQSQAQGDFSTVFGFNSFATGTGALALGGSAIASKTGSVALGTGATTGTDAADVDTAVIGGRTFTGFAGTVRDSGMQVSVGAAGYERQVKNVAAGALTATSTDAVNGSQLFAVANALETGKVNYFSVNDGGTQRGNYDNSGATGSNAIAVGTDASASGPNDTVVGNGASTTGTQGNRVVIGNGASVANSAGAVAIGPSATATSGNSVALGINSRVGSSGSVAIGSLAVAGNASLSETTQNAVAIGLSANAGGFSSIALGNASRSGVQSVAVGYNANAMGSDAVAMGRGAIASANNAVALGIAASAEGINSVALGRGANASLSSGIAIGYIADANEDSSISIGATSKAYGANAIVLGNKGRAMGNQSISIGTGNVVTGNNSGAIGDPSNVSGNNSYALGNNNTIAQDTTFVVGNGVSTTQANSVVLGNASTDRAATAVSTTTINGVTYNYAGAGSAANGVVSVGAVGKERQIVNVAAGRVSASSTDAINGSQLLATNQALDTLGNRAVQYDANADGTVNRGSITLNSGGASTRIGNVANGTSSNDAVNLSQLETATSSMTSKGMKFTGNDKTAGDVHRNLGETLAIQGGASTAGSYSGGNLKTVTDPKTGSISLQMADAPKFGGVTINADGGGKITGVGVGTLSSASTDAVNGSQLYQTNQTLQNLGNTTVKALGGGSTYDPATGTVTAVLNVGGKAYGNVSDAVNAVSATASAGWNLSANGDAANNVASGGTVTVQQGGNIAVTRDGTDPNKLTIATTPDLTVTSLTAGNTVLNNGGVTVSGGLKGPVRLTNKGLDNGGNTITGVGAGTLSATSTDVVNGSQLYTTNQAVSNVASSLASGMGGSSTANADGTVTTVLNVGGKTYNSVSDAVNAVSTAAATGWNLSANGDTVTKVAPGGTVTVQQGGNIAVMRDGTDPNKLTIATTPDLTVTSVTAGNTRIDTNGLTNGNTTVNGNGLTIVGGPSVTTVGIDAGSKVISNVANGTSATDAANMTQLNAVAATAGAANERAVKYNWTDTNGDGVVDPDEVDHTRVTMNPGKAATTIDNVAAGEVSATSKQAVNGSQLYATNQAVSALGSRSVRYDTNADGTINRGSITLNPGGTATQIHNVANGTSPNDAVNLSQLNAAAAGAKTHYYSVNDGGKQQGNYNNDGATGANSLAVGVDATAGAAISIAIGNGARTTASSKTNGSVVIGSRATDAGMQSTVIGFQAGLGASELSGSMNSNGAVLIGTSSGLNAELGYRDIYIGYNSGKNAASSRTAVDIVGNNVGIGANALEGATGSWNVVLGGYAPGSKLNGSNNVAVGGFRAGQSVVGYSNIALGSEAGRKVTGNSNISIGSAMNDGPSDTGAGMGVVGSNNIALGARAGQNINASNTVSIGTGTYANADGAIVMGNSARATGQQSTAIGLNANTGTSANAIAFGSNAVAGGDNSVAFGREAIAATESSVAMGYQSNTTGGVGAIAIGDSARASASYAIAIGRGAQATGGNAISIGTSNVVTGNNSGAIGDPSNVSGNNSYALGNNNTIAQDTTFVVGNGVTTTQANSVVLGNASADRAAEAVSTTTINGVTYNYAGAGSAANGVVSVGAVGKERQIVNVAAGRVGIGSTDAVNGSQLFATNMAVGNVASSLASGMGGSSVVNPDGTVTTALSVGGKTYNNVSEAIGAVSTTASAGWRLTAQGANGSNVAAGATVDLSSADGNLKLTKSAADNNVTFGLNSDLTLTSITTGNTVMDASGLSVDDGAGKVARYGAARVEMSDGANTTTLDANGLAVAGGPSITVSGIDAGGMPIANVGAGVNPTDAVNMSQLNAVGNLVNAGWTVLDANGNRARIAPDGRVTFTGDGNVTIRQTGADQEGKVEVALNRNLSVDSLTTGGTLLNANGLTIAGGPSLTVAGIDAGGQPITNVGMGTNPTDAVNLAQLNAASMGVKAHYYGVNSVGGGNYDNDGATGTDAIAIGKDALASHDGSIALGNGARTTDAVATPSGTIAGVNYRYAGANPHAVLSIGAVGMERALVNVAAGRISADSTDAVNGSQLYAAHQAVEAVDGRVTDLSGRVDGVTSNISNLANRVDASEINIAAIQNGAAGMFQVNQPGGKAPAPTGANSVAGGSDAVASGDNSTAVGNQSVADGANSTAIGLGARATGGGSIAIGAGSTAVEDNVLSVGSIGAERRITNVAPGVNGTDAVNLNQLKGYAAGGLQYDKNPDGSVNYNSMTLNPGGTGPTLVRNVAAGVASTDAVNVGQLKAGLGDTLNRANAYTDQRFNDLSNDVWTLRRDFRGATASAMAMAGLPQAYLPGKSMLSAGVGGYQGQYGIAVGLSGISENGTWVYKAQASGNTAKDWGFSAGMGVQW